MTTLQAGQSFSVHKGQEYFLLSEVSRLAVWLNKSPAHWVLGAVFGGGGMGCKVAGA